MPDTDKKTLRQKWRERRERKKAQKDELDKHSTWSDRHPTGAKVLSALGYAVPLGEGLAILGLSLSGALQKPAEKETGYVTIFKEQPLPESEISIVKEADGTLRDLNTGNVYNPNLQNDSVLEKFIQDPLFFKDLDLSQYVEREFNPLSSGDAWIVLKTKNGTYKTSFVPADNIYGAISYDLGAPVNILPEGLLKEKIEFSDQIGESMVDEILDIVDAPLEKYMGGAKYNVRYDKTGSIELQTENGPVKFDLDKEKVTNLLDYLEDRELGDHNYIQYLDQFVRTSEAYVEGLLDGSIVPTPRDIISLNASALQTVYQNLITEGPAEGAQGEPVYGQPVQNATIKTREELENLTAKVPGLEPLLDEWDMYTSEGQPLMYHVTNPANNPKDDYGGSVFYVDPVTGKAFNNFAIPQDFMEDVTSYFKW
ncbi:hypothetical protein KY342_04135 [Candidatus Woesearchaeota archaeon]|nr:hypothetical protein [Candidatus Woesearchaeota archaeon]